VVPSNLSLISGLGTVGVSGTEGVPDTLSEGLDGPSSSLVCPRSTQAQKRGESKRSTSKIEEIFKKNLFFIKVLLSLVFLSSFYYEYSVLSSGPPFFPSFQGVLRSKEAAIIRCPPQKPEDSLKFEEFFEIFKKSRQYS
jgi:hypothetical protein